MMPSPTARFDRAAGPASGGPTVAIARDRQAAGAGFSLAALLAVTLAACSTAPANKPPADSTRAGSPASTPASAPAPQAPAPATATQAPSGAPPTAARPSAERPAETGDERAPAEVRTATPTRPPDTRPPDTRTKEAEARTEPRSARRAAEATPLPAPAGVERREAPPLPRVAREAVPQVRAGDDVVALAVEHGFDPVPVPVPDDTRFSRLRIGMTKQDAEALLGRPDTSLHYANEGARIPFYASDDSSRWETFYRGQGRLMFSGAWLTGEVRLIRIEFDPDEDGQPDADHPQRNSRQPR